MHSEQTATQIDIIAAQKLKMIITSTSKTGNDYHFLAAQTKLICTQEFSKLAQRGLALFPQAFIRSIRTTPRSSAHAC